MRRRLVGALAALALWPHAVAAAGDVDVGELSAQSAVVLELFTSQGCSTCPPAEKVLSRLTTDARLGPRLVPLAFHVDYFNQDGWLDPFSARDWTLRQQAYARALGGDGPYTPQLVVDGRAQFPGGNEQRALAEIATAFTRPPAARLGLKARRDAGRRPSITVELTAALTESIPARRLEVLVALFENRLSNVVERGENGGRTLDGDYVVRRLECALSLDPKAGARKAGRVAFKLDRAWNAENVGVAAFVQDPASMRIYGAAALASLD
jgi:hypothetical protein